MRKEEANWFEARDLLLGENLSHQNVGQALDLARLSSHPDACWLTHALQGKDVDAVAAVLSVLHGYPDVPLARCLMLLLRVSENPQTLRAEMKKLAEQGCALAQARFAQLSGGEEKFSFAWRASRQQEREGFYQLGMCYSTFGGVSEGVGCDLQLAKLYFKQAADLGDVYALRYRSIGGFFSF